MRRKTSSLIVAIALFTVAGMVIAQNADQNTGGPTKNTLKLRLVEPAEGATISGNSVRVTVGYNGQAFGAGQGTRFGESNFPQPRFDVYVDNSLKATLKGTENNTATIDNIAPGSHKIAVVALNVSGEVIDRKEIDVTTTSMTTMAENTTSSSSISRAPAPAPAPQAAPPPAPAPSYEPAPAPAAPAETSLPHTASSSPRLALAGLALMAGGLLIGKKTR
ncbi:MAG TPA: LPXTG cell wall anchor domain-containing protein [Thermoanaerobaculia bacterium]|nr:LPXTG cell wall anchor domain-containing protein [Thermoanaerobaculia bacterium]